MSPTFCVTRFALVLLLLGWTGIPARAQTLETAISRTFAERTSGLVRNETHAAQAGTKPSHRATRWGTALGVVAAVSVTAWAASSYGENEGGRFCSRCFMQWSVISIPVGAATGAGVGYLIDRLRR